MEGKPADACIEATALYSVVWAFEASLPQKARAFFNILVRQMSASTITYTKVGEMGGGVTFIPAILCYIAFEPYFVFLGDCVPWCMLWSDFVLMQGCSSASILGSPCLARVSPV